MNGTSVNTDLFGRSSAVPRQLAQEVAVCRDIVVSVKIFLAGVHADLPIEEVAPTGRLGGLTKTSVIRFLGSDGSEVGLSDEGE